ncbi:MAG: FKBP-type peptidyl-prolyl cis-trans isomerase [Prevotellaceae bacterium]|jgi:FKBP-type peptidyl-prolyl cis-trans isomerase FklB|nr:FKBP-type peptidyl-prolyl cis-trans isomerase [Prevotellaceae bacterium]
MKLKNFLFVSVIVTFALASCDGGIGSRGTSTPSLKTEKDTVDYYLGIMAGSTFKNKVFKDPNLKAFNAGVKNVINGKDDEFDMQEMNMYIDTYYRKMQIVIADQNLKDGENFLAENAKKTGVKELTDGIQYKVETEGTGEKPLETDVVSVHYKGTLIDGTEFDSSYKNGEPVEFPVNRVIPGWTKALVEMPVGSKWTLYIPSEQAYGPRGAGGQIGPNETLIFEIELLKIVESETDETETTNEE